MNLLTIAGHLGGDAEERFTPNGQKVVTLRLATKTKKNETIWYRVTVWGNQFDKMIPYLKKGGSVIVVGELAKPEIYTSRQGENNVSLNVTAHNIMFSPFGKGDAEGSKEEFVSKPLVNASASGSIFESGEMRDDEVPF